MTNEPVARQPRALTREECRKAFLDHLAALVREWKATSAHTPGERLDGLAFSVLVMLDGGLGNLPAFTVTPAPHPDDALYRLGRGEDWWPDDIDLGPALHEEWAGRGA